MSDTAYTAVVDQALAELTDGEKAWGALPLADRRRLLDEVRQLTARHRAEWIDAAVQIKQLNPKSSLIGEEWLTGPYSVETGAAALSDSLAKLAAGKSPLDGATFGSAGGRTTVNALPLGIFDRLLLSGFSAQVWLQPGVSQEEAVRTAGLAQRDPAKTNGIGAVLGAGNILSIAPLDTLYELIANNRVVALKLNPVTDPLLPVLNKVLGPFISIGAVRILTGGADVGTYLVQHESVGHVHMTGSALTHDAIVFGSGADGAKRKAAAEPILRKDITSELGGVSPTIVVPGRWSSADIAFQANHIATQRLHNNGYNCVASQVVVLSSKWNQRDEFVAALAKAIAAAPTRTAYYPGSDSRVARAEATYPEAQRIGDRVLIVDPADRAALLNTEYFSPVFGVIDLDSEGVEFVRDATRLANEEFVGTLGVNIVAAPATIKGLGKAFDAMIEALHYGTVAVNAWTGVGYATAHATWGAFPGHRIDDVQSGIGVVHNGFLIEKPERTVVRGPFRPLPRSLFGGELSISPKPPWFVNNRTAATTGRLMAGFAGAPSWAKLPAIVVSALCG
jgi:aldehyde dehydrogenase (NAD(P)+)